MKILFERGKIFNDTEENDTNNVWLEHKATSNDYEDQYKPKSSQIVILNHSWKIKPDNDLWVEMQVVQRRIAYIGMSRIHVRG